MNSLIGRTCFVGNEIYKFHAYQFGESCLYALLENSEGVVECVKISDDWKQAHSHTKYTKLRFKN